MSDQTLDMSDTDFQVAAIRVFLEDPLSKWKTLKLNINKEVAKMLKLKPGNVTIEWYDPVKHKDVPRRTV